MPPLDTDHEALLFESQRPRLLRVGFRILRSAPEAEDVVQEAWFRWQRTHCRDVENVGAFLTTVVTRLAFDRLRRIKSRREVYCDSWFSEWASTDEDQAAIDEQQDVSSALVVLFETLSPLQRAAFVLREVLAQPYAEAAAVLSREEPAVRQLVHRSRVRLRDAEASYPAAPHVKAGLARQFRVACRTPDIAPLLDLLTSDHAVCSAENRKTS